jgi:tRNA threonylcarbamoyladenosine biosynthesis protein TsaB
MILVIDTATAACSVAIIEDETVIAADYARVGRGHAERLIPMIAGLPGGGRADSILVNCGPGSFTGVRVGIAAARGLAMGWGLSVLGYSTHALLSATAFAGQPLLNRVAIIMEGGHGEVFAQEFVRDPFGPTGPLLSVSPEVAMSAFKATTWYGTADIADIAHLEPEARAAIHLPSAFRALPPQPIYGRGPDAKPMAA